MLACWHAGMLACWHAGLLDCMLAFSVLAPWLWELRARPAWLGQTFFCMGVAPHRVKTPATTAVPKHAGMLACWHAGMLACWKSAWGSNVPGVACWHAGMLACWHAGMLACWHAGIFSSCPMALGTQGALRMVRANLFCMEVAPTASKPRPPRPCLSMLACWHAGMLACWHAGMLACWKSAWGSNVPGEDMCLG